MQHHTSLYYYITNVNVTDMSYPARYSEKTTLAQDLLERLSFPTSKVTDDGVQGPVSLLLSGSNGCSDLLYICLLNSKRSLQEQHPL